MGFVFEASGAFYWKQYSTVDPSGKAHTDGKKKQITIRLCDADGLKKKSVIVSKLAADAALKIEQMERDANAGIEHDGRMTVADFYNSIFLPWLEELIATGQKESSTLKTYRTFWGTYLSKHFNGSVTLQGYQAVDASNYLGSLKQGNGTRFGRATIKKIHSVASNIFSRAVELSLIPHNPWKDVKVGNVPAANPEEGVAFTEEQVEAIIKNLTNGSDYKKNLAQTVLAIGIWAGLRPSEIANLKWKDIDLDKRTILVHSAYVYGRIKDRTKTDTDRTVYYLSPLDGYLRRWKDFSNNPVTGMPAGDLVFPNRDGRPINMTDLSANIITPNCEKHGIEYWEQNAFYACRRGFGTILVNAGATAEEVAQQMGNTQIVVWKFYFKDRHSAKLAKRAAQRYEAERANGANGEGL